MENWNEEDFIFLNCLVESKERKKVIQLPFYSLIYIILSLKKNKQVILTLNGFVFQQMFDR